MYTVASLLMSSSSLWRELVIGSALLLVLALRWRLIRQRALFVLLVCFSGILLGRLYDVGLRVGMSPGWRTLDAQGSVTYDFVSAFTTDHYWAAALFLILIVLPWLISFMGPFRAEKSD